MPFPAIGNGHNNIVVTPFGYSGNLGAAVLFGTKPVLFEDTGVVVPLGAWLWLWHNEIIPSR